MEVNKEIIDMIELYGEVDKDILIDILEEKLPLPEYEKLKRSYYIGRLAQIVASAKDGDKNRTILALNSTNEWVSTKTGDKKKLEKIYKRLKKSWDKLGNTIISVKRAIQLSMFDDDYEPNKESEIDSD